MNLQDALPARAAYDSAASFYDDRKWSRFWEKNEKPIVMEKLLGNPANLKILDLGCGTGMYGVDLLQGGNEIYGVDISEQMLLQFRKKIEMLGELQTKINLIHSDVNNLTINPNYFDVCLAARTLSHVPDLNMALQKIYQSLRPNGYLVITDLHDQHPYTVTTLKDPNSDIRIAVETYIRPSLTYVETAREFGFEEEVFENLMYEDCLWQPSPDEGFEKIRNSPDKPILFFAKLKKPSA